MRPRWPKPEESVRLPAVLNLCRNKGISPAWEEVKGLAEMVDIVLLVAIIGTARLFLNKMG